MIALGFDSRHKSEGITMSKKKRGGGPKTPEGKRASSQNAIKTGVYAQMVVLPGEDQAEFARLEQQFLYDFAPMDIVERALVRDLAVLTWKKLRLEKAEYRVLLRQLNEAPSQSDFTPEFVFSTKFIWRKPVKHFLPILDHFTEEAKKVFEHTRSYAQAVVGKTDWTVEDLQTMEQACSLLYGLVVGHAEEAGLDVWTPARLLASLQEKNKSPLTVIRTAIEKAINNADDWLAMYADLPAIKEEWQALRNERLLRFMDHPTATRARDDLSRAFFRALQELRTHQKWRRSLAALEALPHAAIESPG